MRAIVIGSGIAGLTAAIALRKVGCEVVVYERAPQLSEVGAGISLWANALRALDYIGAGDAVRAVSLSMVRTEFRLEDGHRHLLAMDGPEMERASGCSPLIAMIHRADLVGALAGLLPPKVVSFGHECVNVESRPHSTAVRFKNGHSDEADVVIGADGIHSIIRVAILGHDSPRYSGYTCWRGIAPRPAQLEAGYAGEWWGRGRRIGITTLPGDRVYWWATRNQPAGAIAADERSFLTETFRGWADPVQTLLATTPANKTIRSDIVDRPAIRSWSRGRIGLIGDAAHPTTPNLGQGGCMAIEDSVVLARCLATASDPAAGFLAFTRERYSRTRSITDRSWRFGRIGQWEGRISCAIRNRMFRLLVRLVSTKGFLEPGMFDVGPLPVVASPS